MVELVVELVVLRRVSRGLQQGAQRGRPLDGEQDPRGRAVLMGHLEVRSHVIVTCYCNILTYC